MAYVNFENNKTSCNDTNLNKMQELIKKDIETSKITEIVTETGTDLNDYTIEGRWYFSSSYTPINIPVGSNGVLEVIAGTNFIKQIWYRHGTPNNNDYQTFIRTYSSGTWSDWQQFAMVDKKGGISLLYSDTAGVTGSGTCEISETLDNFRFVVLRYSRNYVLCPLVGWQGFRGLVPYSRGNTGGNLGLFCVRGSYNDKNVTFDDIGEYTLSPSDGSIKASPATVIEIWGIR